MFLVLSSLSAAKKERGNLQPLIRNVFYGYEDCSDAGSRNRTLEKCGKPLPTFECSELNVAVDHCMETCKETVGCKFISITFDAENSECSCSMKSLDSMIQSAQISSTGDALTAKERVYCDDTLVDNEQAQPVKNCDDVYGCIYQLPNVYTAAKDDMDWSFVDACKSRKPQVVAPPMLIPKEKITAPVVHDAKVEMVKDFGKRKAGSKVVKVDVPKENVKVNKGGD